SNEPLFVALVHKCEAITRASRASTAANGGELPPELGEIDLSRYVGYEGGITVGAAAEQLGLRERWVRSLCEDGTLSGAYKLAGSWMIPSESVAFEKRRRGLSARRTTRQAA